MAHIAIKNYKNIFLPMPSVIPINDGVDKYGISVNINEYTQLKTITLPSLQGYTEIAVEGILDIYGEHTEVLWINGYFGANFGRGNVRKKSNFVPIQKINELTSSYSTSSPTPRQNFNFYSNVIIYLQ